MTNLKRGSRHNFVLLLQELLNGLGFDLKVDGYFGARTEAAVRDFQEKNGLKADGIVGVKTWQVLNGKVKTEVPRFVSEKDFQKAAEALEVEAALIKAVQEVETGGRRGFLTNGKPVILFEGHIFWKELKIRGFDPAALRSGNEDILYPQWT
ncbi:MAG TPA: peptidoglycan-binding protein, partial [Anseongella sp.]|nr:peptidoglycan-binding protein [Anseongella sp.]